MPTKAKPPAWKLRFRTFAWFRASGLLSLNGAGMIFACSYDEGNTMAVAGPGEGKRKR